MRESAGIRDPVVQEWEVHATVDHLSLALRRVEDRLRPAPALQDSVQQ